MKVKHALQMEIDARKAAEERAAAAERERTERELEYQSRISEDSKSADSNEPSAEMRALVWVLRYGIRCKLNEDGTFELYGMSGDTRPSEVIQGVLLEAAERFRREEAAAQADAEGAMTGA